jgi:hypothetical protein
VRKLISRQAVGAFSTAAPLRRCIFTAALPVEVH